MGKKRKLTIVTFGIAVIFSSACSPDNAQNAQNAKPAKTNNSNSSVQPQTQKGEQLYKQYCSSCHPDGGNASDPKNNLRKSTLKAKRINKPEDIVAIMRKPISRMITFDVSTISDEDARAIAEYVLEAF